jgi:hypothetical protein
VFRQLSQGVAPKCRQGDGGLREPFTFHVMPKLSHSRWLLKRQESAEVLGFITQVSVGFVLSNSPCDLKITSESASYVKVRQTGCHHSRSSAARLIRTQHNGCLTHGGVQQRARLYTHVPRLLRLRRSSTEREPVRQFRELGDNRTAVHDRTFDTEATKKFCTNNPPYLFGMRT